MDIKEAKEEIKNAAIAYFSKDELGRYEIPAEKQRPVFLMGPPGIGKTAVMEQIAKELNIGLVSYAMTHHTRQSALGLPFISHKKYMEQEFDVSEYTMSEIIASVYELMDLSGIREGILFLDEINCVSETLAPSMLQFLQYKTFGKHRVPDGWIIVTAGNPPEFNNSVREFDIVTWDRLKRIDVEADYPVWKEYALNKNIHSAITTYLDIKKEHFYVIETTVDGKQFVTARGWEDLSSMIKLYEKKKIPVKSTLIGQYLQNRKIAEDFAVYYDLFSKYQSDYQIDRILRGEEDADIHVRASEAKFDERLALIGMLFDAICHEVSSVNRDENVLRTLVGFLRAHRNELTEKKKAAVCIENYIRELHNKIDQGKIASNLSDDLMTVYAFAIKELEHYLAVINHGDDEEDDCFLHIKKEYQHQLDIVDRHIQDVIASMNHAFDFLERAFGVGQEVLLLVSEMTVHGGCAHFVSRHGCEGYFRNNQALLFHERRKEILTEIESLGL